jgi:Domain of unknown function (DUF4382)
VLFSRLLVRITFSCLCVAAIGTAGCGNSCFAGLFNNGNGVLIIKAANPPPTCSLSQAMGTTSVAVLKKPAFQSGLAASSVAHIFVTVQSVRLSSEAGTNSLDPAELAPLLQQQPYQFDLVDGSPSEVLVDAAMVPAGTYQELRLRFFSESDENTSQPPMQNACGRAGWNCIVMDDGHVEPLFPADNLEIVLPFAATQNSPLLVSPDSRVDLRVDLRPELTYSLNTEGWKIKTALVGKVDFTRSTSE